MAKISSVRAQAAFNFALKSAIALETVRRRGSAIGISDDD
jgi:hypothetical protein